MAFKNLENALMEIEFHHSTNTENIEKIIYEATKNKTRIVITGDEKRNEISSLVLHVLSFHDIQTDVIFGENYKNVALSTENDFVLITAKPSENLENLHANIALITDISANENLEFYQNFIKKITAGGVLIFNEENKTLTDIIENTENYFRKLPYSKPTTKDKNGTLFLETELGNIPIEDKVLELIDHIEAAKIICQQLSILEEKFYEAVLTV